MLRLILKITSLYYVAKFAIDTGHLVIMGGNLYHKFYPSKPDPRLRNQPYKKKT